MRERGREGGRRGVKMAVLNPRTLPEKRGERGKFRGVRIGQPGGGKRDPFSAPSNETS